MASQRPSRAQLLLPRSCCPRTRPPELSAPQEAGPPTSGQYRGAAGGRGGLADTPQHAGLSRQGAPDGTARVSSTPITGRGDLPPCSALSLVATSPHVNPPFQDCPAPVAACRSPEKPRNWSLTTSTWSGHGDTTRSSLSFQMVIRPVSNSVLETLTVPTAAKSLSTQPLTQVPCDRLPVTGSSRLRRDATAPRPLTMSRPAQDATGQQPPIELVAPGEPQHLVPGGTEAQRGLSLPGPLGRGESGRDGHPRPRSLHSSLSAKDPPCRRSRGGTLPGAGVQPGPDPRCGRASRGQVTKRNEGAADLAGPAGGTRVQGDGTPAPPPAACTGEPRESHTL